MLSDSTEAYDPVSTAGGKKFEYYSKLPSLREYVLVSQHEPSVQIYYRSSNTDLWQITWIEGSDQKMVLHTIDAHTLLEEFYLKTSEL